MRATTVKKKKPVTKARDTVASARDGFLNLTARMGLGAGNLLSEGTYSLDRLTQNRIKLESMYRGSWIVGVAVDSIAEDMVRAGVAIKSDDAPEQIQELQTALVRLGIWRSLLELIKWGRLYGGALAMLVIDGQKPETPLNIETVGKDQFKGLKIYDRWQLQPDMQNLIQEGMDAGLPACYSVITDLASGQAGTLRIHHSRVLRFIGIQLPSWQAQLEQFWGESIIERLQDRLIAFDTASAGAANLIQKAHLRTVQIDGLREVLAAGGKAEENLVTMFQYMAQLQTNEGVTLLDKNDAFEAHSYTFSGLSDMLLQFGQQIAGATGIPLVRLFGQSPAGLNSTGESDLRMYYDNVRAQQESRLRDGLMRILRMIYRSKFGITAPENFDFDFVPLWQIGQKEQMDIANIATTAVTTAFEKGVIDQATALQELKQVAELTGVYSNITEEQIEESKRTPPPAPVETVPSETIPTDTVPALEEKPTILDRISAWVTQHG